MLVFEKPQYSLMRPVGFFEILLVILVGQPIPHDLHPQHLHQVDQQLVAAAINKNLMKENMLLPVIFRVFVFGGNFHASERPLHHLKRAGAHVRIRLFGGEPLEHRSDREMLLDIPRENAFDKSAFARDNLHQAFLLEHPKRFPDGGPADAELLLQIDFNQLVSLLENPFQDGLGQCLGKLFHQPGRLEINGAELGCEFFHFRNPSPQSSTRSSGSPLAGIRCRTISGW